MAETNTRIELMKIVGIIIILLLTFGTWRQTKITNENLAKIFELQSAVADSDHSPKETVWRNTALCTDNMVCQYVEKGTAFAIDCTRDNDLVTKYCSKSSEDAKKLGIINIQNSNLTSGGGPQ